MRADQKKVFDEIVDGFEAQYQQILREDELNDTPMLRVAFYESCLKLVRDGPKLRSGTVQFNLIKFYEKRYRIELKKCYHKMTGRGHGSDARVPSPGDRRFVEKHVQGVPKRPGA